MEKKTQVDKWLIRLKNNKIIAIIVIAFMISLAAMKWGNEFSKFKKGYSNDNKIEKPISIQNDTLYQLEDTEEDSGVENKRKESTPSQTSEFSIITGRLLDSGGEGIFKGIIFGENGEKVTTDENGFFELKIKKRPNQLKVKILFLKEGIGERERYVGINQSNIILRL